MSFWLSQTLNSRVIWWHTQIKLMLYFLSDIHPKEKAMATHSSTLAWKIPWAEEPGRLQSMGLLRVRHDRATSLSLFTFFHWRRTWQPTAVFLPGEFHGQWSLIGYSPWSCKESDRTQWRTLSHFSSNGFRLKTDTPNNPLFSIKVCPSPLVSSLT